MTGLRKIYLYTVSISFALFVTLILSVYVFQPYTVSGHSMDPTLHDTERLYVSKLSHTFYHLPDYGDVVIIDSRVTRNRGFVDDVLEFPLFQLVRGSSNHTFFVKRVIGKPGDTLEFKDHMVYRNGKALDEPYIKETMDFESDQKWSVPSGHIFVMGDNRNNSEDSRMLGYIPLDLVMGKKILPLH